MSVAALWAWVIANEAAVATILLVVSEFLVQFLNSRQMVYVSYRSSSNSAKS
jgi:hypothetical protein